MAQLTTARKLGLLATLYFAQGLPFGLFTQALPAVMRKEGVSLAVIGLSSLLALPWALKFLWAPWVDRTGSRRMWLLPLQMTSGAVLLMLALADPSHAISWLMGGVLITNLLAATQDIAADGLAVDLLAYQERGLGNAIQVAGYRVGMIVGGGALLVAFERLGWPETFVLAASLMLVASVPIWRFREPARARVVDAKRASVRGALGYLWRDPQRRRWMVVLAVYKAGDYVGTGMLRPFLVDRGLGLADIGITLGGAGFTAGLAGALVGGALIERIGRRRALCWFGLVQAASVASYAFTAASAARGVALFGPIVFEHFATGMATTALFTIMMDHCRADSAATDYTVQASLVVLATGIAAAVGGTTAQGLGYGPNFLLGGIVALIGVVLAWRVVIPSPPPNPPATRDVQR